VKLIIASGYYIPYTPSSRLEKSKRMSKTWLSPGVVLYLVGWGRRMVSLRSDGVKLKKEIKNLKRIMLGIRARTEARKLCIKPLLEELRKASLRT
jgi:hypothetical protein